MRMDKHKDRTIFGRIFEKSICFLIDTSSSMYHQLATLKRHLIEVLTSRALFVQGSMFNIIAFKEDAHKWSETLVQCTTETVNTACQWIRSLNCGTTSSRDTLSALSQAFRDSVTEAIYIATNGLPDQRSAVVLEKILSISRGIPVHCIYLKSTYSEPEVCDFLRDLAEVTRGSLTLVELSYTGEVGQVTLIYTSKTCRTQRHVPHQINTEPIPSYSNGLYNKSIKSNDPTLDSSVLRYAEALIKARGLTQSAGLRCSTTPVASSLMKGVKVLAGHDRDGLYYRGKVEKQGPNDRFIVKFESCAGLRKSVPQEISVHNMIAYEDGLRLSISLGDKVLAPWQRDGRYGPGTVLEGMERRDLQSEGHDGNEELLVTFFNGQTVSVPFGMALRIPEKKFDQISCDILLPESQRRKQKLHEEGKSATSTFSSNSLPKRRKDWENTKLDLENEKLKDRLHEQIDMNSKLLSALDLNITNKDSPVVGRTLTRDLRDSPVIGKATSRDLLPGDYNSGVFSDEESELYSEETTSNYNDISLNSRVSLPERKPFTKSDYKVTPAKRWQYTSAGSPATQPRFRETVLQKPREPGDNLIERPTHDQYQTVAGVSFPKGTDRKFGEKAQVWHPYRQFNDSKKKENPSVVREREHLKHSEYQDASGVKFPKSTDRKFTQSLDVNWTPDTALRNAERQRNWEDGLGLADEKSNARYANKLERIRLNKRRYFKDIEDRVAVKERKEAKRLEFQRNKMTEREEDFAKNEVEQERVKTARMERRRSKQAEIAQHEKDRTEQTERWKTERIEAMKKRQVKFAKIEGSHEVKNDSRKARREAFLRHKETERREAFHDRLREEWRREDEQAERSRRRKEATEEKQNIQRREAEQKTETRFSSTRERNERLRASILP